MELSAVNTMLKNRRRVYLEPIWNVLEDTMHEPIEGLLGRQFTQTQSNSSTQKRILENIDV